MAFFEACRGAAAARAIRRPSRTCTSPRPVRRSGPGDGAPQARGRAAVVGAWSCSSSATRAAASSPSPSAAFMGTSPCSACLKRGKRMCVSRRRSNGGHASAPPKNYARGAACGVCRRSMEKHPPVPEKSSSRRSSAMFARRSRRTPPVRLCGFCFGNLWLFAPLMKLVHARALSAQAGAMLRTTGGLHDALRFGRLQRAAAGGNACGPISGSSRIREWTESLALIKKRAEKYGYRDRSSLTRAIILPPRISTARRGGA